MPIRTRESYVPADGYDVVETCHVKLCIDKPWIAAPQEPPP
jgi:hypothetical protein